MGSYHLAGIAGVGMSALAEALLQAGHRVTGSDRYLDLGMDLPILGKLRNSGADLFKQDGRGLSAQTEALVVSTAVEDDNPEVQKARELGISLVHRSEMLNRLTGEGEIYAVAGTAGKTTTTGILGWLLQELGFPCSVVNGGVILNWQDEDRIGSARVIDPSSWVLEVDESDKSLLNFHPRKAVLTNISKDHYELDELRDVFGQFCRQVQEDVLTIQPVREFLGAGHDNLVVIQPDELRPGGFVYKGVTFDVPLAGEHNAWNSFYAAAMAERLGYALKQVAEVLKNFQGIERRLQKIGSAGGHEVFDDYAHNPAKISAAWKTVRSDSGRVTGVWRPHGFGPLKVMMDEFAESFAELLSGGDRLLLLPVYYVGGTASKSVSSDELAERLQQVGCDVAVVDDYAAAEADILSQVQPGEKVLCLGARDPELPVFAKKIYRRFVENLS